MSKDALNKISDTCSNTGEKMPVLFIGHGSPMNAIEENEFVDGFRRIATTFEKPDAIICISAHWETRGTYFTAMENPPTIHDFGGFPCEMFEVQYPTPGNPLLASEIKKDIKSTDISLDHKWGLDHGAWSVLKHMYPDADVPVIQMSLDYGKSPADHYELAGELNKFREKGILIVGSGNMVHNLSKLAWDKLNAEEYGYEWALEANARMKDYILAGNHNPLINYFSQGKAFQLAIPTAEHFLPLLYVLSLSNQQEKIEIFNDKAVAGSITMTSVKIG